MVLKLDDFAPDERKSFDGDVKMLSSDDYKHQIKSNLTVHGNIECLDEAPFSPVTDDHNNSVEGEGTIHELELEIIQVIEEILQKLEHKRDSEIM